MNRILKPWNPEKWKAPFFTLWTAQALSLLGSQIVQFALIWWLTKTTGQATVLATASLIGLLPQVFLGPVAGALVDRWNRRVVMALADSTVALATLLLALLFLTGQVEIWHVYFLMFVRSAAGSFHWPAMQASTSLMVPDQHLARIQGLNQMLNGGMSIAAAPLGALLLELLPLQGVLAIDVVTAALAIIPLLFIAIPQPPKNAAGPAAAPKTSVWQDFQAGLRYVWAWPGLVMLMVLATVINLVLTPGFALMPLLVTEHFGGQAIHLAGMESTWGVGAIAGGLLLSVWGGFKRRMLTSLVGVVTIGLGSLTVGLAPSSAILLAMVAMFFTGVGNPITNGPLMAVIQSAVAPEMQGRVFTLLVSCASAMSPLGLVIAGPLADHFGVRTWFVVGGVVTILMGLVGLFIPAVMDLEKGRGPQPALNNAASERAPKAEAGQPALDPSLGD